MKNTSIGIQAILAVAVIVLYILHFTQGSSPKTSLESKPKEKTSEEINEEAPQEDNTTQKSTDNSRFAFVNSDTLVEKYEYYQTIQKQLESKRASFEATFRNREKSLQNEMMAFQQSVQTGAMNEQTAMLKQEELLKKRDNFVQDGKNQESYLIKEEQSMGKKINDKISDFLKRFAEENGYAMIFSYTKNSLAIGVMHGAPELNVTNEVIKKLNEEYKAEKDKK